VTDERAAGEWNEEQWWTARWMDILAASGLSDRAEEARKKTAGGDVEELRVSSGRIACKVTAGPRVRPHRVDVGVPVLAAEARERALRIIAAQAGFSAALLNGSVPDALERDFHEAGLSLFPESINPYDVTCTCGSKSGFCEHAAAALRAFGAQFAADPFLWFTARGMDREWLLTELNAIRSAAVQRQRLETNRHGEPEPGMAGGKDIDVERPAGYTDVPRQSGRTGAPAQGDPISDLQGDAANGPRTTDAFSLLALAGDPEFWRKDTSLYSVLQPVYRKVSEAAGRLLQTRTSVSEQVQEEGDRRQWNSE
jgi:uncharacterized Zn finger protein